MRTSLLVAALLVSSSAHAGGYQGYQGYQGYGQTPDYQVQGNSFDPGTGFQTYNGTINGRPFDGYSYDYGTGFQSFNFNVH